MTRTATGRYVVRSFLVLSALCLVLAANVLAEDIRLEGMIFDRDDASQSILVINGQTIRVGETHLQYKVLDAGKDWAKVQHVESGETKKIHLQSTVEAVGIAEDVAPESWIETIQRAPGRIVNRAIELKAIYDLAIINNACVHYYNEKEFFPRHIKQLTLEQLLKESFADGESFKYRFYFDPFAHPDLIGIHADPLDADADLHSFFVGSDAVIRAEKGRPATIKSPPHSYLGHRA